MSAMAFFVPSDPSELDLMSDHLAMSMEYDLETEVDKILQGSDKFGYDYNSLLNDNSNQGFDFDASNTNIDEWISNMQWSDVVKMNNNNLLDNSFEVENNNPNLLVNPQTGMPVNHYSPFKKPVPQISGTMLKQEIPTIKTEQGCYRQSVDEHNVTIDHDNQQILTTAATQLHSLSSPQMVYSNVNNNIPIQTVKCNISSSPSQSSPVLVEHLQHRPIVATQNSSKKNVPVKVSKIEVSDHIWSKPVYSYSCLIALSLKNSLNGSLPVSEIYNFMTEHFPYFKTAPDGWKNSVRHNLSLNKCFAKVETPKMTGNNSKKGCLWALNPDKVEKMEDEIAKHRKKDLESIRMCMPKPELLEAIEAGTAGPAGPREEVPKSQSGHIVKVTAAQNKKRQVDYMLNSDSIMDKNLSLDGSITDLEYQNGLWEDIPSDLEIPFSSSSQLITNSNQTPLTIQSVVSLGNPVMYQNHYTCSPNQTTPSQNIAVPQQITNSVQSC